MFGLVALLIVWLLGLDMWFRVVSSGVTFWVFVDVLLCNCLMDCVILDLLVYDSSDYVVIICYIHVMHLSLLFCV